MSSPKRRGPHPQDRKLFAPTAVPVLRQAVNDLSWLRSREYAENSAMKLVGDRYQLTSRQRTAVGRSACSEPGRQSRAARSLNLQAMHQREVWIDGFNLLITLEAALAGGILLRGRDGCLRDLSSLHGNYHVLADTLQAIRLVCAALQPHAPSRAVWLLDKPVSNSGRLAARIRLLAAEVPGLLTEVLLVPDPDRLLREHAQAARITVSSDSLILASEVPWLNLASHIVHTGIPEAWIIDLGQAEGGSP